MTSAVATLLVLLALPPSPTRAYPALLNNAVSTYAVGAAGPMDIAALQAGNQQTCAINAAAATGYTPGQVYTINVATNGQHAFESSAAPSPATPTIRTTTSGPHRTRQPP